MKLSIIALYFVVCILIYGVLTRLGQAGGRLGGKFEKAIIVLALIWPLWGEFAVFTFAVFVLYKSLQALAAPQR